MRIPFLSICFLLGVTFVSRIFALPTISNIMDNRISYASGQIPEYSKLEISFQIGTSAQNPQWPYDAAPPAGIQAGQGITVNALFTPDNWVTTYTQPAFYCQDFDYQIKSNQEWMYPTGLYVWKVRFAPTQTGNWQYRITAQDASGQIESPTQTFTVVSSENHGFIRVSSRDCRYFEYEDGTYFPGLGYNMNFDHISWNDPVMANRDNFQEMGVNGIQVIRLWLVQWGLNSSSWNPWKSINGSAGNYIPWTYLTSEVAYPGSDISMGIYYNPQYPCNPMFLGFIQRSPACKRNTAYRVRVRYKAASDITGPYVPGQPYGFVIKSGDWLWNDNDETQRAYYPGVGTVLAATYTGSNWTTAPDPVHADWSIMEGTLQTENYDFLPRLYLTVENLTFGGAYVDYVWVEEKLADNQFGPNLISKAWMAHHLYFEQRASSAFDKVVELAEQNGVYLRPVLSEKGDWVMDHIDYNGQFDEENGNYFYGNDRQMGKTRWLHQAWWRYCQARWGYSTAIHSWELLNEGDPFNSNHYALCDELGNYMRQFRPNHHMVSTSNWHSFPQNEFWANANYSNVDFADVHHYEPDDGYNYETALATYTYSMQYGAKRPEGAGKPVIRGETGFIASDNTDDYTRAFDSDTGGVWLHNFIWGGINFGGLIESYWYDNAHIYPNGRDHRKQYGNYYRFIKDIPLSNGNYQDAAPAVSDTNNLRVWGQKDVINGKFHLWIQNKNHTWKNVVDGSQIPVISGQLSVEGFKSNQMFKVQTWDTWTGSVTSTQDMTADAAGKLTLVISPLQKDIAFRTYMAPVSIIEGKIKTTGMGGLQLFVAGDIVHYHLSQKERVDLCVYDVCGRALSKISANEMQEAGSHSVSLHKKQLPAAGMYIIRLRTETSATQ